MTEQTTTAEVVAEGRRWLWLRLPEIHPAKILTLQRDLYPREWAKGDKVSVTLRGEIEDREPHGPGLTAFIIPNGEVGDAS